MVMVIENNCPDHDTWDDTTTRGRPPQIEHIVVRYARTVTIGELPVWLSAYVETDEKS